MVTLQLRQLNVPIGQRLLIKDVPWNDFEQILEELGEHRSARIAYNYGTLEIRMPTPEHEIDKELIGDLVKILLDELEIDCECFGSNTFKRQDMESGIEPDQCFYIQNQAQMRGRRRIDLMVDPPPDLAIEVDVTSKTQISAYEALGVGELWCYENTQLSIYELRSGVYSSVLQSPTFSNLPVIDLVSELLEQSLRVGRSPALRAIRKKVLQLLQ